MVPWPPAGEELARLQREALEPIVVTSTGLRRVRHLKPLRERPVAPAAAVRWRHPAGPASRGAVPLAPRPGGVRFGDAVRLILAEGQPVALSACLAADVAADGAAERQRLAQDLAASGRLSTDFVAVSCGRADDTVVPLGRERVGLPKKRDAAEGNVEHFLL